MGRSGGTCHVEELAVRGAGACHLGRRRRLPDVGDGGRDHGTGVSKITHTTPCLHPKPYGPAGSNSTCVFPHPSRSAKPPPPHPHRHSLHTPHSIIRTGTKYIYIYITSSSPALAGRRGLGPAGPSDIPPAGAAARASTPPGPARTSTSRTRVSRSDQGCRTTCLACSMRRRAWA